MTWYISANRDEAILADPFTIDIERDPNDHVAFTPSKRKDPVGPAAGPG